MNITGPHAECLSFVAEATISKRYAVKIGTAINGIVHADATTVTIGILTNDVDATTKKHASVCVHGVCEAICGAAVTSGTMLAADSAGKLVTATTSDYPFALALETTTADTQYVKVFVFGPGSVT
jgi:hypothetical protein